MNLKILLPIAVIVLFLFGFLGYVNRQSDSDRLFADLIKKMQEGRYEEIYEDSSHLLQLNAKNKEVFTERMSLALEKMKKADVDLNFIRLKEEETSMENSLRESDKAADRSSPKTIRVIQKLGTGDNSVEVMVSWEHKGLYPKLVDLTVNPESEKQRISVLLGTLPK